MQGRFPHCLHSQPSTQSRCQYSCQGKTGFNLNKRWILPQNYLCSRDSQNTSLPSLPMDRLVNVIFPAPACRMISTSQEPPLKQQQQQRQFRPGICIRLKYIEKKFVLEREKDVVSPFWWQMRGGVFKSSHITEQVKTSLTITLKWLISSLQLSIDVFSIGLPPFLTGVQLLSLSPCMTSSARQDVAFHIFLQAPGLSQPSAQVRTWWHALIHETMFTSSATAPTISHGNSSVF